MRRVVVVEKSNGSATKFRVSSLYALLQALKPSRTLRVLETHNGLSGTIADTVNVGGRGTALIGIPKSGSSREVLSCLDLITLGCSSLHSFYCPTRGTARVVVGRYGNTGYYTASD